MIPRQQIPASAIDGSVLNEFFLIYQLSALVNESLILYKNKSEQLFVDSCLPGLYPI
jgi:hypothetical protein